MKVKMKLEGMNSKSFQDVKKSIIDRIADKGVSIVRQEIRKRRLINTGNLIENVGAKKTKNTVTVDIGADYAQILNDGVRPHRMTYLQDAGPIPITTRTGRKIFRVMTEDSDASSWVHPGFRRGKGFYDVSVNKIADASEKIFSSEMNKANKK